MTTPQLPPPPMQVIPSPVKRALAPSLNPTGLASAASAIWACAVMIWNATHHHGVISSQVIVSALAAAVFLYSRFKVTPLADPRDGNGNYLRARPILEIAPGSYGSGFFPVTTSQQTPVRTVVTGGADDPAAGKGPAS